mmetsp:Transcript_54572/g.127609  ORF Transcript_54572/g.127609 Transcript_54572/m.127609 type:complete len:329 (+) Transcript_54572:418-1404(+)
MLSWHVSSVGISLHTQTIIEDIALREAHQIAHRHCCSAVVSNLWVQLAYPAVNDLKSAKVSCNSPLRLQVILRLHQNILHRGCAWHAHHAIAHFTDLIIIESNAYDTMRTICKGWCFNGMQGQRPFCRCSDVQRIPLKLLQSVLLVVASVRIQWLFGRRAGGAMEKPQRGAGRQREVFGNSASDMSELPAQIHLQLLLKWGAEGHLAERKSGLLRFFFLVAIFFVALLHCTLWPNLGPPMAICHNVVNAKGLGGVVQSDSHINGIGQVRRIFRHCVDGIRWCNLVLSLIGRCIIAGPLRSFWGFDLPNHNVARPQLFYPCGFLDVSKV